jgi:hypothetical protein
MHTHGTHLYGFRKQLRLGISYPFIYYCKSTVVLLFLSNKQALKQQFQNRPCIGMCSLYNAPSLKGDELETTSVTRNRLGLLNCCMYVRRIVDAGCSKV